METSVSSGAAAKPVPRLWGSELLLRKVPLYAQARQYAAVNPDDPESEGNTLGYGTSSYPLLSAVRASYNAVDREDGMAQPTPSSLHSVDDLFDRSAFTGIDRAGYAHVPAQRKWMATGALAADVAASTVAQSTAVVRRAAAAAVLDDAAGPPTLSQVLEPWFGATEDRLLPSAQEQQPESKALADGGAAKEAARDEAAEPRERLIDGDAIRRERRKRLHDRERETRGGVYTRLESAIMHYSVATAEEKELLRTVRAAGGDAERDLQHADAPASAAAPSPELWGSRMLSLVTSAVAAESGPRSDEEVEQQQKVLAYLKRVRWIAAQWGSTADAAALRDAAAAPLWSHMTEAARVKVEMAHTQGQRRRYRRTRRGATDAEGGGGPEE